MTTKTAVRWQAALPDGIAHAWADGRTVGAPRPLCEGDIRPVGERHAWPIVAKCVLCLGHEKYGPRQ
jgi:hypothetical protein